jgi:hypothetical protein
LLATKELSVGKEVLDGRRSPELRPNRSGRLPSPMPCLGCASLSSITRKVNDIITDAPRLAGHPEPEETTPAATGDWATVSLLCRLDDLGINWKLFSFSGLIDRFWLLCAWLWLWIKG